MKKRIQNYFALSDRGINRIYKAGFIGLLQYLSFMLSPMIVFSFVIKLYNGEEINTWMYLGLIVLAFIITYVASYKDYVNSYDVTYDESTKLRISLMDKMKKLPLSFFSKRDVTDISQTIMKDVYSLEETLSHAVGHTLAFFFFLIIISVLSLLNNPILGLCFMVPIWLTLLCVYVMREDMSNFVFEIDKTLRENSVAYQEVFDMQEVIKSNNLSEKYRDDILKRLDETERYKVKGEFKMAILSSLIGILPYISIVLVAIVGAILFSEGKLNIIYYFGYLMATTTVSSNCKVLLNFINMILYFKESFKRIRNINEQPIQLGKDVEINNFDIELNNVDFGYGSTKVLDGVSFKAKQGEVTALVGPSGCGKTTIIRLISRLYDYQNGEILVGGKDIKEISTKSLYKNITYVFQNVELFNMSIFENIRLGRETATDDEVIEAAKLANVDKIVAKLPDGYNTLVGENGSRLSGGERLRISIARALLKDAPIVLLDEISASLDVENEMEIQKGINSLIKNKTVIIISHRMKSIQNVSKIVVLDDGKVVGEGTHQELLDKCPLYKNLVKKSELTSEYAY